MNDIVPGSPSITIINDSFRHYIDDVQLWSFYETLSTKLGIIVEKDSAVLDSRNERKVPLNADHRNICKFDSPSDPNYRTLRNALISTKDDIVIAGMLKNFNISRGNF